MFTAAEMTPHLLGAPVTVERRQLLPPAAHLAEIPPMPELPEVETIVRDLGPGLTGRTIRSASLRFDDLLRGITRPALLRGLRNQTIHRVFRRAKHAVLDLGTRRLVIQPGMTGVLLHHPAGLATPDRYEVLRAALDDDSTFVYRDIRRLGTLLLLDHAGWERYDSALGPEPLDPAFTPEVLGRALARTRQAIKKALMDQRVVVGVGNIYANEALFFAGIDPSRPALSLTGAEVHRVHHETVSILRQAITSHGTTLRDYRRGTGETGDFQLELQVYGREGEPCRRCGTLLAGTHTIDARITVFCWRCQG